MQNKYEYIQEVLDGSIDLRRKTLEQIYTILKSYVKIDDSYNYLIKMSMDSVSIENVETLKKQFETKQKEAVSYFLTCPNTMRFLISSKR